MSQDWETLFQPAPKSPQLLRHAFLWRFSRSSDRQAMETVVLALHWMLKEREAHEALPSGPPPTELELEAAVRDLMACAEDLEQISRHPETYNTTDKQERLSRRAGSLAAAVAAIAGQLIELLESDNQASGPDPGDQEPE